MFTECRPGDRAPAPVAPPVVDVVIPVHDEERDLAPSVRRLDAYLAGHLPFTYRITIADNGSRDSTWAIATRLAGELGSVRALHLDEKGRGRALAAAWLSSDASVLAYMDVDLSTDLAAVLPLVAPLVSGHSQVSVGSRLAWGARVVRGPRRQLISRCYNLLLQVTLGLRVRDAQCGFKALRADTVRRLLPEIQNRGWFFDTELLVLAQREGLRVLELPVDWVDDPDSRVNLIATALEDLRGIWRLLVTRRASVQAPALARQLGRFAAVGVVSTIAYAGLYWALRSVLPAVPSNALALLATAVANTAANRRLSFGIRGRQGALHDHLGGLAAFAVALVVTGTVIVGLRMLRPAASRPLEVGVLTAASGVATGLRFLLLRALLFHARHDTRRTS